MTEDRDREDAELLAEMAADGIDLSRPLAIEFMVAAPDDPAATAIARAIRRAGHVADIVHDAGEPDAGGDVALDDPEYGPSWTVYVSVTMVPTPAALAAMQRELDDIARPLGGYSDGWGTLAGDP